MVFGGPAFPSGQNKPQWPKDCSRSHRLVLCKCSSMASGIACQPRAFAAKQCLRLSYSGDL
jgi:hypothetical protein